MTTIGRTPFNEVCLFDIHGDEVYHDRIWAFGEAFGWVDRVSIHISKW